MTLALNVLFPDYLRKTKNSQTTVTLDFQMKVVVNTIFVTKRFALK